MFAPLERREARSSRPLRIGRADDAAERSADAMAERVLSGRHAPVEGATGGAPVLRRQCQACQQEEETLRPKAEGALSDHVPASVDRALSETGSPLPERTRAYFEPRFGIPLGGVRVHAGETAARSARDVGAAAYTVGGDIVFGAGRYAPESASGTRLLAHELAHVAQADAGATLRRTPAASAGTRSAATATGGGLLGSGTATGQSYSGDRSSASPGGNVTAAGEAPIGTCRVDVRATYISDPRLPFRHLFIVHEDAAGNVTYFRSGPSGGTGGSYGTIVGSTGPYGPGTPDWDPGAPSVRVASGPSVCGTNACLAADLARITGTSTPYSPTGPNSNTTVRTLLHSCGLPERQPVSSLRVVGWGDPYL